MSPLVTFRMPLLCTPQKGKSKAVTKVTLEKLRTVTKDVTFSKHFVELKGVNELTKVCVPAYLCVPGPFAIALGGRPVGGMLPR